LCPFALGEASRLDNACSASARVERLRITPAPNKAAAALTHTATMMPPTTVHRSSSADAVPIHPHQSINAEPQVKPEPNAAQATFMPRSSLPLRTASASKIGMVAAVVLP
jgi:hypothetical protein